MSASKRKLFENWKIIHKDMSSNAIEKSFLKKLEYALSKDQYTATANDTFLALALSVRDRLVERWITTQQNYHKENVKRVYYLSMEFLIGRLLGNYIFNLGLEKNVRAAIGKLGLHLEEIRDEELDAGLGNGGLGRLAACFLDSMATLGIPAYGYGIRYDYGIFHQKIKDGYQVELPDEWLRRESPWEFARPEYAVKVQFYGRTEMFHDNNEKLRVAWHDTQDVLAVPYDVPIPGYKNDVVNTLRLWSARSTEDFDLEYFNVGDYEQAVHKKIFSEVISKVLYPNDDVSAGRELRLKQEYFFVAASISDIIRRFRVDNTNLKDLPEKVAIQLNDTHPTLAVVEVMRILLDNFDFEWDDAWGIVQRIFAYTNHTILPEALERWSVPLLENILPRHLQIIYEINARFLDRISQQFVGDEDRLRRMSIIEEGQVKKVRMAHLAIVASGSVNGVSELHTYILKHKVFKDFYEIFPEKFNNKTNGITQRRWLLKANEGLSDLITKTIGDKWTKELSDLKKLENFKEDAHFRKSWQRIKFENKKCLADFVQKTTRMVIDPHSMYDIHVKRIHEYKRQILFGLNIISQYLTIKNSPGNFLQPRTFIAAGKAAPGYFMAKLIIKFLNSIADVVNRDKDVQDKIRVVFLENYRVSLAEKIFPASDLSEQISTAGTEASGTGCMKFMLNGALTIGTLDGATIEMAKAVGNENIFLFGLTEDKIQKLRSEGYDPEKYIASSAMLSEIVRLIKTNFFSIYSPGLFAPILDSITKSDPYFICADFDSYCSVQDEVSRQFADKELWTKKSIVNVANSGKFSSDRAIKDYARDIWKVPCKF